MRIRHGHAYELIHIRYKSGWSRSDNIRYEKPKKKNTKIKASLNRSPLQKGAFIFVVPFTFLVLFYLGETGTQTLFSSPILS